MHLRSCTQDSSSRIDHPLPTLPVHHLPAFCPRPSFLYARSHLVNSNSIPLSSFLIIRQSPLPGTSALLIIHLPPPQHLPYLLCWYRCFHTRDRLRVCILPPHPHSPVFLHQHRQCPSLTCLHELTCIILNLWVYIISKQLMCYAAFVIILWYVDFWMHSSRRLLVRQDPSVPYDPPHPSQQIWTLYIKIIFNKYNEINKYTNTQIFPRS